MSEKWAATFHGPSGARTFVGVCGVGEPTEVTPSAAAGLVRLGWTPPPKPRGPRCGECRLGLGTHNPLDPRCYLHEMP